MKPINPDFAPVRRAAYWPWWALSALLFGVAAFEAERAIELVHERHGLEAQAQAEIPKSVNAPAPAASAPYYRDAAQYAALAGVDVAGVLAALESARVPGARVTALDVRVTEGWVRVELEVRDTLDLLRYIDDLNAGMPSEDRWSLTRSQAVSGTSPGSATLLRRLQVKGH